MKQCSQCKASPKEEQGPKIVQAPGDAFVAFQVRCWCGLHTGWFPTELEAQKAWKDDSLVTGWKR